MIRWSAVITILRAEENLDFVGFDWLNYSDVILAVLERPADHVGNRANNEFSHRTCRVAKC